MAFSTIEERKKREIEINHWGKRVLSICRGCNQKEVE